MRRILKIVLINFILLLFVFFIIDFMCSVLIKSQFGKFYEIHSGNKLVEYIKHYKLLHNYSIDADEHKFEHDFLFDNYDKKGANHLYKYRPIENLDAKNSVLIFGCSVANGEGLSDDKTFSYNFGKLLPNYKIFNRGNSGFTTSHMLYQLENKDFSKYKNVKYIIYVFIVDHIPRNYNSPMLGFAPYYSLNNDGELQFDKYSLKYIKAPVFTAIKNVIYKSFWNNYSIYRDRADYKINLTKAEIEASMITSEKIFPDAKFVVLRYDAGVNEPFEWMFETLKDNGCIVISLADLSDKDYFKPEYKISKINPHPNAKAWKEITPLFVEYLQARGYLKD